MEKQDLAAIHKMNVDDAREFLPELTAAELGELRAMEMAAGDGKTRKTLVSAIDAQIAAKDAVDAPAGDDVPPDEQDGTDIAGDDDADPARVDYSDIADEPDAGDGVPQDLTPPPTMYVTEERVKEIVAQAVAEAEKRLATAAANEADIGDAMIGGDRLSDATANADLAERERIEQANRVEAAIRAGEEAERRAHEDRVQAANYRAGKMADAYARAQSGATSRDVAAVIQQGGHLFFCDGTRFLHDMGPVTVEPKQATILNGKISLSKAVLFDPAQASALVTEVWLAPIGNEAFAKCDIPGGLRVGGGHEAQLPAGHLAFDLID